MSKTIHIHLHRQPVTRDSGNWEESKHPRAENGQFGKGSGGAKPAAKKSAPAKGSSKPLHVQRQEKLDAEKAAKANPHLHSHLGSGEPSSKGHAGSNGGQPSRPAQHGIEAHKHERASKAPGASVEQQKSHERARWFHEKASKAGDLLDKLEASGTKSGSTEVARKDYEYYSSEAKKASEAANKSAPIRSPQYTPMRQAMRNQEAAGIREARRVTKAPRMSNLEGTGLVLKSVAREQGEATLQEVLARIRSRKK